MIFIAEVILTIFAWRKGWRVKALWPMGIAFFTGFSIALVLLELNVPIPRGLGTIIDMACIGVLIKMVVSPPKKI